MEELTFMGLIRISIVIPILMALSVICLFVALERWFFFIRHARISHRMLERIRIHVKNGNIADAKKETAGKSGYIASSIHAQLEAVHLPRNERESLVLLNHQRFQSMLGKRLWVFGTLSFICPLVGLLGTVLGVIRSFGDLAKSASAGPSIVAAGISEALYATACGIAVAITAAVIYNYFNIWMKDALSNSDIFSQEIIFITSSPKAAPR